MLKGNEAGVDCISVEAEFLFILLHNIQLNCVFKCFFFARFSQNNTTWRMKKNEEFVL